MTDLPPGWEWTTLGDLAAPEPRAITDGPFGSALTSSHYTSDGARVIRLQNIGDGMFIDDEAFISLDHFETLRPHEVRAGDLLVASLGDNPPRACIAPELNGPAIVKADCIRIRLHPEIDADFVLYSLLSPATKSFSKELIKGVGRPRLGLKAIRDLPIPLPPLTEQRRIVAIVNEVETVLSRGIKYATAARSRVNRLTRACLEKEIGSLAQSPSPLSDLCRSIVDGDHQAPPRAQEGVPFLVIGDMRSGSIDISVSRHVPRDYYESLDERRRPRRGDVLYSLVGSFGLTAEVATDREFCVQRHIGILRPRAGVDTTYLAAALTTHRAYEQAASIATGTAQKTVPLRGLRQLLVANPESDVQRKVVERLAAANDRGRRLVAQLDGALASADRLRRATLTAALNGELGTSYPADEPASALLERVCTERAAAASARSARDRPSRSPTR